ncbi:MAG TPA: ATP-binding protein [Methylomirabilota bacterium]|nr:ATP-binding protein [Methylomirabilota bacterium]
MSKVVKIAFVGGPSAGKTTLFNALEQKYAENQDIAFLDEVARQFFSENIIAPEDRSKAEVQARIQDQILSKEQQALEANPKIIICDRSVIDSVVYAESRKLNKLSNELLERIKFWIPTYTTIYLLDINDVAHAKDDIRYEDSALRQKIHQAYLDFFARNNIKYELLSGTLYERIAKVNQAIKL